MRTLLQRRLLFMALLVLAIGTAATGQSPVTAVEAVGLTVSDMDRSVDFYSRVLHFQKVSDHEFAGDAIEHLKGVFGVRVRVVEMKLGDETLELSQYLAPEGLPIPVDSRSNDRWFQHVAIIVRDMEKAYAWLRQNKVRHASSGPQRLPDWNKNAGGIEAFYFRDPDGHNLEILHFPEGKGDRKWHRPGPDLFMGIDHTAIVVGDSDASLAFYRGILGMRVAGESENYGTEQEHLNNVRGARLRITALRAASGPGIELLEYLAPRDGRPFHDAHANDVVHWETHLSAGNIDALWKTLRKNNSEVISSAIIEPTSDLPGRSAFLVKDPDGHAVMLIGKEEKNSATLKEGSAK